MKNKEQATKQEIAKESGLSFVTVGSALQHLLQKNEIFDPGHLGKLAQSLDHVPTVREVIEKAGTVIGDNDGRPVATPHDDCVLVMPSTRQLREGVTVVRFARQRPL